MLVISCFQVVNGKNFEKKMKKKYIKKEQKKPQSELEKGIHKSWDRPKTRKGGLGKKQVVRKALGLGKIGLGAIKVSLLYDQ